LNGKIESSLEWQAGAQTSICLPNSEPALAISSVNVAIPPFVGLNSWVSTIMGRSIGIIIWSLDLISERQMDCIEDYVEIGKH